MPTQDKLRLKSYYQRILKGGIKSLFDPNMYINNMGQQPFWQSQAGQVIVAMCYTAQ